MQKEEQVRLLKGLINYLETGTNVDAGGIMQTPTDTYTSEERFSEEWNKFFRDYPQIVGMTGDLAEPGTFFTREDFGIPLLATRDEKGKFRAFANVCAHRGVVVENEKKGKKTKFSCPFHGWTYDNSGKLIGFPKPDHFGNIDKTCYGLTELPCMEQYGFLWVHPNPKGEIDLNNLFGSKLMEEFESWGFQNLVLTNEEEYVTEMNWKLAIDTFGETYHFPTLHRNTLFNNFHGNVQMFDTFERNARLTLCLREIDNMKKDPEENWHICRGAFPVYFLFPNTILNVSDTGIILVREYPLDMSPHRSVSKVSFYFWPKVIDYLKENKIVLDKTEGKPLQDGVDGNPYLGFGAIIRDEDYVVAAASHKGLKSGAIDYLTFGKNELALHHYHNTYREALDLEPLPLIKI
ncbi:MAG TPA: aromatic ring-hydroxylating dioxygenase subunit alpha [Gammaproteobacteria bacterium]|jgi:nitrite reductase/ring-hydroxylating ferredoxin subunit|nr:aromatic ring-hydroxylating dioxygenase subunit alpha [Gammaproteobacteria bacterium]